MKRLIFACLGMLALAACQSTIHPSESYYAKPEVARVANVDRCRVIDVRQVSLGAEPLRSQGYYSGWGSRTEVQPEAQIGAVAGLVAGALIGSQFGSGSGREIATQIGALAGAAGGAMQGTRMAQARMARAGIEYSVLSATGQEQVIVQYLNPGDRIVPVGATCRIAETSQGARVMPAGHLPATVARPATTTFSN